MKKLTLGIYIIGISLGLYSCKNHALKADIEKMTNQQIAIPDKMRTIIDGRDSVVADYVNSVTKLIVWYDSVGCSSCEINKLHEWNSILTFADGMQDKFNVVFIFTPKSSDRHMIDMSLKMSMVNAPLFIDYEAQFIKQNPELPQNRILHTFLVDKDNRIQLVGSPLHNEQLWELYKTTIRELTKG